MQYDDELYGKVEITEPLLLELITSDAMQRTKGVSQHGITALIKVTPPFSRFVHSVGTMLLVRRLGASVSEQIAALLHDISHTAFSHVIDFVFDDHSRQSYHEEKKGEFLANSDIPAILNRHGRDWKAFMHEKHFPLLEQPLPGLCADRLDYFLRDLEFLKLANGVEIQAALESLEVVEGQIAINDFSTARWLAYTFIEADRASWSNFREVGLYQLTAEAIKAANRYGLIGEADLWGSDEALWRKLESANHPEVMNWVKLITPGTRFTKSEEQPVFSVSTKVRSIDPPVTDGRSVTPLSVLDPDFARCRNKYLTSQQGQWSMGIVNAPKVMA
jgi:hypothetical protein